MTDAGVTLATAVTVTGKYAPQGVAGALSDFRASQSAKVDATSLTLGTTSGKVDLITCSDRTLTAGASATYDLLTGTDLKDLAGLTCAFVHVKYICVSIASGGDAAGVTVGNAAANGNVLFMGSQTDKVTIYPGGPPFLQGTPVTGVLVDATHKNLKVLNNGAVSATVRIVIAGTST